MIAHVKVFRVQRVGDASMFYTIVPPADISERIMHTYTLEQFIGMLDAPGSVEATETGKDDLHAILVELLQGGY